MAYPATVIGLIFSDVPGDNFEDVASGPTYPDKTTLDDAKKIIAANNLGDYDLLETPKESRYFEKVYNFVLVSNKTAVNAMAKVAAGLGLPVKIVSTNLYDEAGKALDKILTAKEAGLVLAAGEPSIKIGLKRGKGGRSLHLGLLALRKIASEDTPSVFVALASDGLDNSDAAGAIVDKKTIGKASVLGLSPEKYLEDFSSYDFFEKTGDIIKTGATGANVSDLMILLNK